MMGSIGSGYEIMVFCLILYYVMDLDFSWIEFKLNDMIMDKFV